MDELLNDLNNVNDPSAPVWANILIKSMKVIIMELKCVKDLTEKIVELEKCNSAFETTLNQLQTDNKHLHDKIINLEYSLDDQEQRNRNYCLLLHGVEENERENTDDVVIETINKELGLNIKMENIQRSHRVGPRNNSRATRNKQVKSRPIIFRFRDFRERQRVFKNKKLLKGKGISISENLTKKRYALYQLATTKYGRGNVWTIEGRITTKINNKFVVIHSESDLV